MTTPRRAATPRPRGGLLRLAALSGEGAYERQAIGVLRLLAEPARKHPEALAYLLGALDLHLSPMLEVALVAPASEPDAIAELAAVVRRRYRPRVVVAARHRGCRRARAAGPAPRPGSRAAAYVCERFACQAPVTTAAELARALGD